MLIKGLLLFCLIMEYVCFSCGHVVELEGNRIRCPFCGGKVLFKQKPKTIVTVDVK